MGKSCKFRTTNGCSYDCKNESDPARGISAFSLSTWDPVAQMKLLSLLGFRSTYAFDPKNFFICSQHFSAESIEFSPFNGHKTLKKNPQIVDKTFDIIDPFIRSFSTLVSGIRFFFTDKLPAFWHIAVFDNHLSLYKLMSKGKNGLVITEEICIDRQLKTYWLVDGIPVQHDSSETQAVDWETLNTFIWKVLSSEKPPTPQEKVKFDLGLKVLKKINWEIDAEKAFKYATMVLETIDMSLIDIERTLKWKILLDQLKNFFTSPRGLRYCWETRLAASFIKNVSTAAYKVLTTFFNLPSTRTLSTMARNLHSTDNVSFLKNAAAQCTDAEKNILIAVDEIALDPKIEYKSGRINGFSHDGKVAKTAQGFFASSVAGKFSELISLEPINGCTATVLKEMLFDIIDVLQECGFTVVCIVTDNHTINQSLFKILTKENKTVWFPNPTKEGHKIFCRFDQVHLFKNIRNAWLNKKDVEKTFLFPDFLLCCWLRV